jgi:DNA-binding transcriptional ArsR family regulator
VKPTDELLARIAERLKAMADATRLRILHALEKKELCVSDLVERAGSSQANVSKHLALLRKAGLVAGRREGGRIYYRVADGAVWQICATVCKSLDDFLERERQALGAQARPARRRVS